MDNLATFLAYLAPIAGLICAQVGSGLALGIATKDTMATLARQPAAHAGAFRMTILGLVMIESSVIIALVVSIITLMQEPSLCLGASLVRLGSCLGVGLTAGAISLCSARIVHTTLHAVGRQPFLDQKLSTLMIVAQSLLEAPVIFALLIALMLRTKGLEQNLDVIEGLRYACAGILLGFASAGPAIGQAMVSTEAIKGISDFPESYSSVWSLSILLQALIETPVIFCLVLVMVMLYQAPPELSNILLTTGFGTACLTLAFACTGTGIGMGYVGKTSCQLVSMAPQHTGLLARATLLATAFIESVIIYALIVAMLMIVR